MGLFQLLIEIMNNSESVDRDILLSLLEFRRVTETFSARKAALRISPAGIAELEDILVHMMIKIIVNAENKVKNQLGLLGDKGRVRIR